MNQLKFFIVLCLFGLHLNGQNNAPKNIIIMIGDGMGFEHIDASLYYQGQAKDNIWNTFPVRLSAATYNAGKSYNSLTAWKNKDYVIQDFTESAAASTAISTGSLTLNNQIGISTNGVPLTNPVQIADKLGKSTGVVTSVPFCHATPAGFVGHNVSRLNYGELALEMIMFSRTRVIMGCGHPMYNNDGHILALPDYKYFNNENLFQVLSQEKSIYTSDNTNYIIQDMNGDDKPDPWLFSDNKESLDLIIQNQIHPDRFFFLAPAFETLSQMRSGTSETPFDIPFPSNIPDLSNMSLAALEILSNDTDGFFLMIEGGAIDWAAHENDLTRMIEEMMEFEKTAEAVCNWISVNSSWDETLLIVLADHECGYLLGEFDEIQGFQGVTDMGKGNLPGGKFLSDNHSNHLVPFFARGAMSHVFEFLASDMDSVRGNYLHISDVGKTIRYFWGEHAFSYPASVQTCSGSKVTISATSPYDMCTYHWYVNNTFCPEYSTPVIQLQVERDTEVYCQVICNNEILKTNISKIQVMQCSR